MHQEDLPCPRCGYDLHGIPEVRCPECGLRYDAAALRSMAAAAEGTRFVVARVVTLRATIAAGLAVPAVCDRLGVSGWALILVVAVVYVAVFVTWVVLTDNTVSLPSAPHLLLMFVGLAVGVGYILAPYPFIALIVAVLLLGMAWWSRLVHWPALPPLGETDADAMRRLACRQSVVATLMLVVASLLVFFAFL